MMLIPFEIGPGEYNVFVILEAENLARMKDNDPAQVDLWKLPEKWNEMKLRTIIISSPNESDIAKACKMMNAGHPGMEYLSRGFAFKPEHGDSDLPYSRAAK